MIEGFGFSAQPDVGPHCKVLPSAAQHLETFDQNYTLIQLSWLVLISHE